MTALLEATGITKEFPGTKALDDVSVELRAGEIHAVVGENGAGKSTLMKILSGVHQADRGKILFEGREIRPSNPREALEMGIAIVHQELSLVPTLTVAENIYPARLPTNRLGFVQYRKLFQAAQRDLDALAMEVQPRALVSELSIANQQLVEIAKALSSNCKVLILDEPTSALTEREVDVLFGLLRRLAAGGVGILYISHKLEEVFKLTDRVTVLRDGRHIGTNETSQVTTQDVIRMMVGRQIGNMYPAKAEGRGAALFEVRDLQLPGQIHKMGFTLYGGEILGLSGLIGSGRSELARAIFGADKRASGELYLHGDRIDVTNPEEAIHSGLGYLPEDRKQSGLFLDMAVKLNIESANRAEVTRSGFISRRREKALAEKFVSELRIHTPSIEQEVRRLSGGNQQKTLVAKWLAIEPKVLIVDEPTRGVDVGAKSEIHHLLRVLANQGVGVIMISSELPEILGMSDRILVMHEGDIVGELDAADATEEKIMHYASGQAQNGRGGMAT